MGRMRNTYCDLHYPTICVMCVWPMAMAGLGAPRKEGGTRTLLRYAYTSGWLTFGSKEFSLSPGGGGAAAATITSAYHTSNP
eukprot:4582397-Prymnesium_polylepis.1